MSLHAQDDPALRAAQEERLRAVWQAPQGIFLRWTDCNNNRVGAWYTLTAFGFMLFAGVLALVMRTQLAVPENDLVSANTFNQLFTLHGLLRFQPYRVVDQDESSISLVARIHPQHGWPFTLDIEARYELGDEGLTVTYTARNLSGERAPVAFGTHPFFRLGATPKAELVVTVPADIRYAVDERLIPTGTVEVDGGYDLRAGKALGELSLDDAFGGLAAQDGRVVSTVAGPDGVLNLWQEQVYGWIQVYTTDIFPTADGPELAIAIEPMTAPPNALNTGEGLQWLEPGERFSASWGVGYTAR